jgi:hypothetical protein
MIPTRRKKNRTLSLTMPFRHNRMDHPFHRDILDFIVKSVERYVRLELEDGSTSKCDYVGNLMDHSLFSIGNGVIVIVIIGSIVFLGLRFASKCHFLEMCSMQHVQFNYSGGMSQLHYFVKKDNRFL